MPRRQLVQVSGELTAVPALPAAPAPAVSTCDRPSGCFSNRQLEGMLSQALDWGGRMADQLGTIRDLMQQALRPSSTEQGESP